MKTIILDTDFILNCVKWKIDLKNELKRICDFSFEICVIDKTIDELKGKQNEAIALNFIKDFRIIQTLRDKPVDELILALKDVIVATQDKELKEKLKKGRFPVITIRQKKFLMIQDVL